MGHDLDDDEIAIVISPKDYKDPNKWEGETNVSIAISPEHNLPDPIINGIVDVATMMSAFLDLAHEQPYLYAQVKEHRDYLMAMDEEDENPVVTKEGNVYTLNKWTKTKGSA
jgi:hypothetical protein|tara:strand:+ start:545 stop:880 length:336 start_codon:yes stop_codon:yes gene_type:complete